MPLTLKNPEVDRFASELGTLTGETLTQAVRIALPWDHAAIQAILDRCAGLPVLDTRSADEILGYDENGLPN